jgi:hypothetical protein
MRVMATMSTAAAQGWGGETRKRGARHAITLVILAVALACSRSTLPEQNGGGGTIANAGGSGGGGTGGDAPAQGGAPGSGGAPGAGGAVSERTCTVAADCAWGEIAKDILVATDCPCLLGCPSLIQNKTTIDRRAAQYKALCHPGTNGQGNPCPIDDCIMPPPLSCNGGVCVGPKR